MMKRILMLVLVASLMVTPALAANDNGCGLGKIPRASFDLDLKKQFTPPFFVKRGIDGDGKVEGRADSFAMARHNRCVAAKKNN